jgi:hypothetical protein
MRRFSKQELHQLRELVEKGASLKEISFSLGRGKSAVQYQVSKLRGKRAREKVFSVKGLADEELGWLIGCYAGDGSRYLRKGAYSYEVKFALNENEYAIVRFVETILSKCGMKTRRSTKEKRVYVRCLSKHLYEFVERYLLWDGTKKSTSVRLRDLSSYSTGFLLGFLCGIVDADGGTKRLYISTSSERLMNNIMEICEKLEITAKKYTYDVFHIYLNKAEYKKTCQKHAFSSFKHSLNNGGPGRISPSR